MKSTRGITIKKRAARLPTPQQRELVAEEMRSWFIGIAETERAIKREFLGPYKKLSDFALGPKGPASFNAYLVFTSDKALQTARKSGMIDQIVDRVYAQLERQGRGRRNKMTVSYFIESKESLKRRGLDLHGWMR